MLRSLNNILGSVIEAKDGELGHVHDFLFDDRGWTVRYLVVETGGWLGSRRVLLSPSVAGRPDWEKRVLPVELTMNQVRQSPDVDTAKPVSRQEEIAMSQYYQWPAYWTIEPPIVPAPVPTPVPVAAEEPEPEGDPHLRSAREMMSYEVKAVDADLGKVDDLIIEDANWFIRYLVVSTGSWFSGQKLMVSSRSVRSISWASRQIELAETTEQV